MLVKKVVIIGPESTGKSTLCTQLAQHYHTLCCDEYAREYLLQIKRPYTYDDLLLIAQEQVRLEDEAAKQLRERAPAQANVPLILDTNMYVMKVWCEVVFNNCHSWILQQAAVRKYDLYLLCNVDLPWVQDGLREYPDLAFRKKLLLMYQDLLVHDGVPWVLVSGPPEERLQQAINAIDSLVLYPNRS